MSLTLVIPDTAIITVLLIPANLAFLVWLWRSKETILARAMGRFVIEHRAELVAIGKQVIASYIPKSSISGAGGEMDIGKMIMGALAQRLLGGAVEKGASSLWG